MDGAMYTAVSLNLAEGIGSFWQPIYGQDFFGLDGFYENPPLGLFNLSLFFRVFGDAFWVERLFVLCCLILSMIGIQLNLKLLNRGYVKVFWFSLLLWILMPTMFWTFRHAMMEVQLISILLINHAVLLAFYKNRLGFFGAALLFGLLNLAAFLVKGPVGTFLIAAPFLLWFFLERKPRILWFGVFGIAVPAIAMGLILVFSEQAQHFFDQYLFVRTAERLANNPTVSNRFWILGELIQQLALPLILVLSLLWLAKKRGLSVSFKDRWWLYFLTIAFAGSLPLMISLVQRPFYLATSFPFFAIALTVLITPMVDYLQNKAGEAFKRNAKFLAVLLFLSTLILTIINWGKYKRDEQLFRDISACVANIPLDESEIYVTDQVIFNWSLKAYMMRYERIDLLSIHGYDPDKSVYVLSQDYVPPTEHGQFQLIQSYPSFKLYRLEKG